VRAASGRRAADVHLDAVRGGAALLVLAYHIRYKFFLDYSEAASNLLTTRLFYVATSFGHDAVMVFFVLSGYLITGSVMRDVAANRWSWSRYLLNRLTRLYVVFIPGLLLTVGWDLLGLHLFPSHPAYTGVAQSWTHDFFDVGASLTPAVFASNLFFRHAVAGAPPLGSNSPLWSLTYEFAYYLLFPLGLLAVWTRSRAGTRVACAVLAGAGAYYFGIRILVYFPIWLMGMAVGSARASTRNGSRLPRLCNLAAVTMVVALTAFRHTGTFQQLTGAYALDLGDYLVGASFAVALWVLLLDARTVADGAYNRLARGTANISYTLYVVHMPFLIFLRAFLNGGAQWSFGLGTAGSAVALFIAAIVYASGVWYLFESRTIRVREWLSSGA